MEDINFSNLKELYERLKPALTSKKDELRKLGYDYIDEFDIWKYLSIKKWKNSSNLLLYQMVDDIINVDNFVLGDFYKDKMKVDD